ncbi:MAG: MBL fold metallo-hydrolase [Bacteroidales bacterium]|nr:MBL fold metallo-hydrolase [Bacteroidales bacterium]
MEVSILTDNAAGIYTAAEHGLSYLIEHDGRRILFDTGQSDLFLKNAEIMNIDMDSVDTIILSHGHYDHGNGLKYLSGGTLICHPGCFGKKYGRGGKKYIGLYGDRNQLEDRFEIISSAEPYRITENIFFLGEIPRVADYESKETYFTFEDGSPDYIMDDSAVAIIHEQGLFVVTGCGHAGVVNTLEHATEVTGEKRIYGIMGGFHLKENNSQTKQTIKYLQQKEVKQVYPSHCTALPAVAAFYDAFGMGQLKTGETIRL